jgi:predicted HTH domain antitoxin
MKTIILELPEFVHLDATEARMILAARMYEQGDLSSGQAAEFAGVSKRAFIEALGKYGVSLFSESMQDLEQDLINARNSRS